MRIRDDRPRRHIELEPRSYQPVLSAATAQRRWTFVLREACIARQAGSGALAAALVIVAMGILLLAVAVRP